MWDRLTHPTHTFQPTNYIFTVTLDCPLWIVDFYRSPKATTGWKKTRGNWTSMKKTTHPTNLQSTAAPMSFLPISMNFSKPPHPALPVKVIQNSTGASWVDCYPGWSIAGFWWNREADFWMSKVWDQVLQNGPLVMNGTITLIDDLIMGNWGYNPYNYLES